MKKETKFNIIISVLLVFVVALDQILKYVFTNKSFVLIPNVLSILYKENSGAAYSILEGQTLFLCILTIVFLIMLVVFDHYFKEKNVLYAISYGLILGGAFGNLFDRIRLGFVKDFIKLDFINFPVFNIADICLTAGVIGFIIFFIFFYGRKKEKNGTNNIQQK